MKKISATDPEARSADLVADNIARLKALFPELVTEGKHGASVNVDVLKALVSDATVTDAEEKYGLNWHGKRRARQLALTSSTGTLRPCPEDSLDWDTTQNLMIEGDNLEVLKLLQKSYAGKVKLIYIDPPYNTGKDFIYPDNFQDNITNYLELTGQIEGGRPTISNAETSGRFHTDWLNMMYPRLKLARNLMAPDGVLFISIDQGELGALKMMLDEIFGEENFINVFSWVRTRTPAALSQKTKNVVEYVICYERSRTSQPLLGIEKPAQSANTLLNQPNAESVLKFPAGVETGIQNGTLQPGEYGSSSYKVELLDSVDVRDGLLLSPFRLRARFRWSQDYLEEQLASGTKVRIATDKLLPSYEKSSYGREALPNLIDEDVGVGTNESAGVELEKLMGARVFDYPKPVSLLRYLINSCTSGEDIVLDFFAGSGTTAQAVIEQNALDGGRRRFILVQLPELLDSESSSASYCSKLGLKPTISSLTRERLRRVSEKYRLPETSDIGFKSFVLDSSNIRAWDARGSDLPQMLFENVDNILPDRDDQDILFEVLLKLGLPLTTDIQKRFVRDTTIYGLGGGLLFACLKEGVGQAEVEDYASTIVSWRDELSPTGDVISIFRDASFADDVTKTNLSEILNQAKIRMRCI
ncbi:site-specific DNA-methyltransferase [Frateuria sp. YIM B11624]|uniref:site-specific DNA-methyltransferase n=1 Tax=Frateuria sp. YIM B11624 TaxID=3143185 RepID=UPI003C78FF0C